MHHLDSLHNIWSIIGQLPRPFGSLNRRPICLEPSSHFVSPPPLSLISVILLILQRCLAAFVIAPFQYEHTTKKQHCHIKGLFDILSVFEEWKKEAGGFNNKFITRECHEDLCLLVLACVFGIACHACLYLKEDGSRVMHQGRRAGNPNPNQMQTREGASRVTANNAVVNNNMFRGRKGGANAVGAGVNAEDYFRPIPKRRKTNK